MARSVRTAYRQDRPCSDCPFNDDGPGRVLRDSLQPGRWDGILADLRAEKTFPCHQTQSGPRWTKKSLVCAGAIRWQRAHDCLPQAVQVAERLTRMQKMARRD